MDIDKEAICIQYVLYYYKDILYGEYIIVENDQNNIIHRDIKYSRFIHWKLLTEYFAAELVYISGECIFFFWSTKFLNDSLFTEEAVNIYT